LSEVKSNIILDRRPEICLAPKEAIKICESYSENEDLKQVALLIQQQNEIISSFKNLCKGIPSTTLKPKQKFSVEIGTNVYNDSFFIKMEADSMEEAVSYWENKELFIIPDDKKINYIGIGEEIIHSTILVAKSQIRFINIKESRL